MLGLSEHIGSDPFWVALLGEDQDLRGAGDEINTDIAREEFLGGGNIGVAGADDAVDGFDGGRAESHSGDGLSATDSIDFLNAKDVRAA
jgi:hypothetical protein